MVPTGNKAKRLSSVHKNNSSSQMQKIQVLGTLYPFLKFLAILQN